MSRKWQHRRWWPAVGEPVATPRVVATRQAPANGFVPALATAGAARPPGTAADKDSRSAHAGGRWNSRELFGMAQEVLIEHGAATYRLRMTSTGKLILTK